MRAKLQVSSVTDHGTCETIKMHAVGKSGGYADDGLDEDNTYAQYTPQADFSITVGNPALLGKIKAGQKFYVDFTEVEQ